MTGTTFFINANGYSLTNAHVAYGCKSLKVVLPDGEAEATLVNSDVKNDLALLKLTSHAAPAFAQLHSALPRQGEDIVVYGFPLAGALASQGNLTTGIISALSGMQDDSRLLQVSAPIQPGNSGGPLLNDEGQVVGIINSSLNPAFLARITGNLPQNVNFAIKTSIATNFLDSNNIKYENGHARPVMHTADIGDLAKSFTYMVKCQH
jgi:S1-C subfamily serine protease